MLLGVTPIITLFFVSKLVLLMLQFSILFLIICWLPWKIVLIHLTWSELVSVLLVANRVVRGFCWVKLAWRIHIIKLLVVFDLAIFFIFLFVASRSQL